VANTMKNSSPLGEEHMATTTRKSSPLEGGHLAITFHQRRANHTITLLPKVAKTYIGS